MISWLLKKLAPRAAAPLAGLQFGGRLRGRKPIVLDDRTLRAHVCISGRPGVGRSILLRQLLAQQTAAGRGWVHIDPAGDDLLRDYLASAARAAGRAADFYVLDLAEPANSHTYDVLRAGCAEARARRVLTLLPGAANAGEQQAGQVLAGVLAAVFEALDAAGISVGLQELADLLHTLRAPGAREPLLEHIPEGHPARAALAAAVDELAGDGGVVLRAMLAGAAAKLAALESVVSRGSAGVVSHPAPEIDFEEVLARGKMVMVRLPTMGPDRETLDLARMVLQDVCSALHARATLPGSERQAPFLVAMEGFQAYGLGDALASPIPAAVYSQARGLGVCLMPVVVNVNWDRVQERDGADALSGNTFTKVYFNQDASAQLARQHPGISQDALQVLRPGQFVMYQGATMVEGRLRYTDIGTPPRFRKQPMPVVGNKPRWAPAPTEKAP